MRAETAIQAELGEIAGGSSPAPSWPGVPRPPATTPVVAALAAGDAALPRAAIERHVEATYDWIVGLRLGRMGD